MPRLVAISFALALFACNGARSDLETTCHAIDYSRADGPAEVQLQTALVWAGERVKSKEGKGVLAAMRVEGTSPNAAASILRDHANRAGLAACPIADSFDAAEAQFEKDAALHRLCHTRWEHVKDGEIIAVAGKNGLSYTKEIPSPIKDLHAALVAAPSREAGRLILLDAVAKNASGDARPGFWKRETADTCWLAETLLSPY